jgi:protocatechuate 3,4-dioxygenase beta subunit
VRRIFSLLFIFLISMVTLAGCSQAVPGDQNISDGAGEPVNQDGTCRPTPPDGLGPFYEPGAPQRRSVGEGYRLSGRVQSAEDCTTIPGAQIEFWLAGPDGEYSDEYRATMAADSEGAYSFESHPPPAYAGRPPHIHVRVSAEGYQTLVTQHYPQQGETESVFDLTLTPET